MWFDLIDAGALLHHINSHQSRDDRAVLLASTSTHLHP
jgi:hypothetical protein